MDVFMSVKVSSACGSARGEDPASPLAAAAHGGASQQPVRCCPSMRHQNATGGVPSRVIAVWNLKLQWASCSATFKPMTPLFLHFERVSCPCMVP